MAEEPVLGYVEARMFFESLQEELPVPERYSAMWECGRTDFASEDTLDAPHLIFEVLGSEKYQLKNMPTQVEICLLLA